MYCFRFNSRNQFRTLAAAEGLLTEDDELITASHTHAIDEIGVIYEGGTYDAEGEVITPPTALPGWHVNYQGELPEGWEAYAVFPQNPVRVWA
jgi:hypothetical protein